MIRRAARLGASGLASVPKAVASVLQEFPLVRNGGPPAEGAMRVRPSHTSGRLAFDMFDPAETAEEAKAAATLERLYHKGQRLAWDGKAQLQGLVKRHGAPVLPPERAAALQTLFAVIMWGELAAWKISAELALHLKGLEPKLAATAQAHDEARHFYVMHDYLALLGDVPTTLGPGAREVLERVMGADTLAKKLLGMQLMVEPMALTIFQVVRELEVEPVLSELLVYYERDEARHVALGVLHLPRMLQGMTVFEVGELYRWQLAHYWAQFRVLHEIAPALRSLGVDPRRVLILGREKQILAAQMLAAEIGQEIAMLDLFKRITDFRGEWDFPEGGPDTPRHRRLVTATRAALQGLAEVDGVLSNVAVEA